MVETEVFRHCNSDYYNCNSTKGSTAGWLESQQSIRIGLWDTLDEEDPSPGVILRQSPSNYRTCQVCEGETERCEGAVGRQFGSGCHLIDA